MRTILACSCVLPLLLGQAAAAAPAPHKPAPEKPAAAPKALGTFDDWTAATYDQSGQTVCYAFTRAQHSAPEVPKRGQVLLTVTERPGARDSVAMEAGFGFAPNAAVKVEVGSATLDFYTAQRNAFARDDKAAVAAFDRGSRAVAHAPGPNDRQVTDTFSLKGFSAAHAAILKACPGK
jgi:hypothetical protein